MNKFACSFIKKFNAKLVNLKCQEIQILNLKKKHVKIFS